MPRYWLSYDLGLRGDHRALYAWLDSLDAKECGDSAATFVSNETPAQIARQLKKLVDPGVRLYLISRKEGGRFIVGKRRAAPWAGYAVTEMETEIEK